MFYVNFPGVISYNAFHGCQKCTTVGVRHKRGKNTVFPKLLCDKRTDELFRARGYVNHYSKDGVISPIQRLPIDMIDQFPVADSLHLIDLGVTKRLLNGWNGTKKLGFDITWSVADKAQITYILRTMKMPKEFHRAVRGLDELANWKGTEYRTFLHYVGVVILRDFLGHDRYEHFLYYFCAITICSSTAYTPHLHVARALLVEFVEEFKRQYGLQYITSNIHNLIHAVDDVAQFGPFTTFSTYEFEYMLGKIKRLLRTGNLPLQQAVKRISEINALSNIVEAKKNKSFPIFESIDTNCIDFKHRFPEGSNFFTKAILQDYVLIANNEHNQWFLSRNNEVVRIISFVCFKNEQAIYGSSLRTTTELFTAPVKASALNIFTSDCHEQKPPDLYTLDDIKFKLVPILYKERTTFIPLLHSNSIVPI